MATEASRDDNPFGEWLESGAFSSSWVIVAQSVGDLLGAPWVNALLVHADDPAAVLTTTTAPVCDIGQIYGQPADPGELPQLIAGADQGAVTYWPFARQIRRPGAVELEPFQPFLAHHGAWPEHVREQHRWKRMHQGVEQVVARWTPDTPERDVLGALEVFRPALLSYLHAMGLHMAFFFDKREQAEGLDEDWRAEGRTARLNWRAWNSSTTRSMLDHDQQVLHGVELLVCPPEDPEREPERGTIPFPVAIDPDSGQVITTSWPDAPTQWTAVVGAGNDNFLTPLFFGPGVLERYHADSRIYAVTDATVRGWEWSLQVALTGQGNLQAYLGDMASLPRVEQEHWASHAVFDDQIPESRARADFEAVWPDGPTHVSPVAVLRAARRRVNQVTEQAYDVPLLPDVEPINRPAVTALRTPANEVRAFQQQVVALYLLINDSISGSMLKRAGSRSVDGSKTLKRLQVLLETLTGAEEGAMREPIAVLWELQDMRSKIAGVHDASDADKVLDELNPSGRAWDDWFAEILERASTALDFIATTVQEHPPGATPGA